MNYLKKRETLTDSSEGKKTRDSGDERSSDEEVGKFSNFKISQKSQENLIKIGFNYLFPIQAATFKIIFDGVDLIGRDRTGSGKTLAFSLPLLERFRAQGDVFVNRSGQCPVIVILVPTRELAIQVTREFNRFKNNSDEYRVLSVYGGTPIMNQIRALERGVDIVVGTPGRLIDLQERRKLSMQNLKTFILDETDQMLNFGFQEDIEKILKNAKRDFEDNGRDYNSIQYLLFSATVPAWVNKIAEKFMNDKLQRVDMVKGQEVKTSKTVQHFCIQFANKQNKVKAIGDVVMVYGGSHGRTIIFTDKKVEANDILLEGQIKLECQVLHGDIPQKQREVTFKAFRDGNLKCLIATNVAARGLDIPEVDLIIQLSPPNDMDAYIHRSGRTGRAGKNGTCITFFTKWEQQTVQKIEYRAKIKIKKIGMPQISDIMRANARDISLGFDKVSQDVLPYFGETVKDIFSRFKPEDALCRALAIITGYTKIFKQRSLLFSTEGYITYVIEGEQEVRSQGYFWNVLRSFFSPQVVDSVKGMKFLSNKKGVIFDVEEQHKKIFEDVIKDVDKDGFKLSIPTELPEFEDYNQRNNSRYGNNRNGGYGRNGYDNSRGRYNNRDRNGGGYGNRGYSSRGGGRGDYNNRRNDSRSSRPNLGKDELKLFVANLPYDIEERDLSQLVQSKGHQPVDIFIVKDQDRKSKGFGYIKFTNERDAKSAFDDLQRERISGRSIRVDYADKRN